MWRTSGQDLASKLGYGSQQRGNLDQGDHTGLGRGRGLSRDQRLAPRSMWRQDGEKP